MISALQPRSVKFAAQECCIGTEAVFLLVLKIPSRMKAMSVQVSELDCSDVFVIGPLIH